MHKVLTSGMGSTKRATLKTQQVKELFWSESKEESLSRSSFGVKNYQILEWCNHSTLMLLILMLLKNVITKILLGMALLWLFLAELFL